MIGGKGEWEELEMESKSAGGGLDVSGESSLSLIPESHRAEEKEQTPKSYL